MISHTPLKLRCSPDLNGATHKLSELEVQKEQNLAGYSIVARALPWRLGLDHGALGNRPLYQPWSTLTGGGSRHRVSAILARRRPATPVEETLRSGQAQTEVIVASETVTTVMPDEAKTIEKVKRRIIPFV